MKIEKRVTFGKTGRQICPIGISASYGLSADGVEEAVDHGVNYIYFGSMRRKSFGDGLRRVIKKSRDDLIIVLQTYLRIFSGLQTWDIERGLRSLNLDYVDVMLLGWFNSIPSQNLIDDALTLKEKGRVKMLAVSTHNRRLVPEMMKLDIFDIYHIRYNAVHRGAEGDIFPFTDPVTGPGLVAFTATCWRQLLNPKKMPPGEKPLSASEAYRFCLSDPHIHTIATGPKNREQLRESLSALDKGPLTESEMQRIRAIGDYIHGTSKPSA